MLRACYSCTNLDEETRRIDTYFRDISLMMEHFESIWCEILEPLDLQQFRPSQQQRCVQQRHLANTRPRKARQMHKRQFISTENAAFELVYCCMSGAYLADVLQLPQKTRVKRTGAES
ncbi:hypothetical protein BDV27DRAFT_124586 [Aspergillus caelatus]|uniref:Uncharacterized protein n=1 Tax=Aspergillus caelatus TaxID=61420 RepID=A0A5N7AC55_9EURO|nr:uncharacterized protein BDV27DRAFT_124586 [Aspergillus caelatus]KAE8366918.1 hypothetical protein BDV27DRAFT_124586 [Aspergillus caelatus]